MSFLELQCALWGFNGGDTAVGNPYKCLHVDIMHQLDLGVFKTLVDILRILGGLGNVLQMLDKPLLYIKATSCYQSFRILGTDKGGYFRSNANFTAFEH